MEANKFVEKMILVPIERWNQLLDNEKENSTEIRKNKQEGKIEKQEIGQENQDLIPPGIPEPELSEVDETLDEIKPVKKKRKTVLTWQKLPVKPKINNRQKLGANKSKKRGNQMKKQNQKV